MPSSVGILVYSEETSRVQRMQSLGNLEDSMYLINSLCLLCRRGVTSPEAEASGPSKRRFSQLDHCSRKLWA